VDLWRRAPVRASGCADEDELAVAEAAVAERRCESRRRRWSARSFLRWRASSAAAAAAASSSGFGLDVEAARVVGALGGFEDCVSLLEAWAGDEVRRYWYHEGARFCARGFLARM